MTPNSHLRDSSILSAQTFQYYEDVGMVLTPSSQAREVEDHHGHTKAAYHLRLSWYALDRWVCHHPLVRRSVV